MRSADEDGRVSPPFPPIDPPRSRIVFPDPRTIEGDVVAVGTDFRPGTLLHAYRQGIFPWPQSPDLVGWFSPDPRAIFRLEDTPHWSRSLRRTMRKHGLEVTLDEAFPEVIRACGDERAGGTWILPELVDGYVALHDLGWAHSVEVWEKGRLVGGIYGITVGGLFAGESMFHRRTDASKIAFVSMVERLQKGGFTLFDVQVMNDHLASLGCAEISRADYLERLSDALTRTGRLSAKGS